jgi:hypothetical protein
VGEMFMSKIMADDDPCRTALGQSQPGQDAPATKP